MLLFGRTWMKESFLQLRLLDMVNMDDKDGLLFSAIPVRRSPWQRRRCSYGYKVGALWKGMDRGRGDGGGGARGEGLGFWSWGEGAAGGCFIEGKMCGERPVRGMALGCDSDVRALVRTKEGDGRQQPF